MGPLLAAAQVPLWTDKVIAVATAVAAGGLIFAAVGVFLAFDQIKETRKDRHIQVVQEFGRRWDGSALTEASEALLAYNRVTLADHIRDCMDDAEGTDFYVLLRIPNFYEDLAMVAEGLESIDVAKHFGPDVLKEWAFWEDAIRLMQEDDPSAYTEFSALVDALIAPPSRRYKGSEAIEAVARSNEAAASAWSR